MEWTLRFDEDGDHHWEAPGISAEEKEAASIDLGQLAQAPSPCLDPEETSFSDQVPQSVRISIRQQVVTEAPDPELIDALAKKNVKMHTKEEGDPRGTREHMIMRAICDERIGLPMDAFKDYPEVYAKIAEVIPIGDMMDVKVAWRCNTSQYWHCEVSSAEAGPIYQYWEVLQRHATFTSIMSPIGITSAILA